VKAHAPGLAALLAGCVVLHGYLLATTYGATYDIDSYVMQAYAATHHLNVYDYTLRYPYPPVWIWIVGGMSLLASAWHIPFNVAVKLPGSVGDVAMVVLLYAYARSRTGGLAALAPAALYALNPIPALISAGHGQFDSLPALFTVLAFHLRGPDQTRRLDLAALALGVAIALKGYPFLVLPYLAMSSPPGRILRTFLVALLPLLLSLGVYAALVGFSPAMLTHVLGYTSSSDLGWSAVLERTPMPLLLYGVLWLGSDLAVIVFATIGPWLLFRRQVELGVTALFAVFYLVIFRSSVQYLIWGLPFFCLALPWGTLLFSLAGTSALVTFYARKFPNVVPFGAHDLPWAAVPATTGSVIASAGVILLLSMAAVRAPRSRRSLN
jgi:hypothetical protein